MKSIMLSHSDITGGAFIAAYRTHQAIALQGIESSMWVDRKSSDDWTVQTRGNQFQKIFTRSKPAIARIVANTLFKDKELNLRSYNCLPSRWPKAINNSDCDLAHLHWCNAETLSIKDFSKIKRPVIQSLHDMWFFCGAEHYSEDSRWKIGYSSANKPSGITGFDIDQYIWKQKSKYWTRPRHLVAVSHWLADCVSSSALLSEWSVTVIPNPVDTTIWRPLNKQFARNLLNLPMDKSIVTFGAIGGSRNPRKGFTLLQQALKALSKRRDDIHVVIYGQSKPNNSVDEIFPTTYMGKIHDPFTMIALNNAADVYVNPATQEAFGQTGSEAQACGLPVVAFDQTGSTDVVEHLKTGYLAQWKDSADLAVGIQWALEENQKQITAIDANAISPIGERARNRAVSLFSYEVVGAQFKKLYNDVLEEF